jgi:Glyoxalase-like domain
VSLSGRSTGEHQSAQHEGTPVNALVDHLVVVARTLAEGVAWCQHELGIEPGPGGRHPLMGTHNRLFSIATEAFPDAYFEIVAVDPQAPPPDRARWFDMDGIDVSRGPRLAAFVARVDGLDAALASLRELGFDNGRALAASRQTPSGLLHWRIAVRDDGASLCGGALPTLIEWGPVHPAASMPDSGVALRSLTLRGLPTAAAAALNLSQAHLEAEAAPGPALEARLDTPRGTVTLFSH